jgi:hypothetical protein
MTFIHRLYDFILLGKKMLQKCLTATEQDRSGKLFCEVGIPESTKLYCMQPAFLWAGFSLRPTQGAQLLRLVESYTNDDLQVSLEAMGNIGLVPPSNALLIYSHYEYVPPNKSHDTSMAHLLFHPGHTIFAVVGKVTVIKLLRSVTSYFFK